MTQRFLVLAAFVPIVLLTITSSQAQEASRRNGIRAGYHLASMVEDGSKPDDAKNLSSFYVGFFREQPIKGIFSFNTGLEYFQNGQKLKGDDSKRVLHTLSIPVNLKVKIGPAFGVGGITANFKMAERIHLNGDKEKPSDDTKASFFDSAAFAGAGIKISVFIIEARYYWGLINVDNGLHNRYFQLGGAVLF